jgi:hypothetical protein
MAECVETDELPPLMFRERRSEVKLYVYEVRYVRRREVIDIEFVRAQTLTP